MPPRELLQAGKLREALQALTAEVRDHPGDAQRRTFLFELLCFAGEHDRAAKHLDVLAEGGPGASMGALLCRAALEAEKLRQETFTSGNYPESASTDLAHPAARPGMLNGKPFASLQDADPRIGPRIEVYAGGNYLWIPIEHLDSIEMQPPRRLRDLLWAPATLRTGPAFRVRDLGEVFLPVLSPFSWKHSDDAVRLGRASVFEADAEGNVVPFGQKTLLVDDDEFPILELRSLTFTPEGG